MSFEQAQPRQPSAIGNIIWELKSNVLDDGTVEKSASLGIKILDQDGDRMARRRVDLDEYLPDNAPAIAQDLSDLLDWVRSEAEAKILPVAAANANEEGSGFDPATPIEPISIGEIQLTLADKTELVDGEGNPRPRHKGGAYRINVLDSKVADVRRGDLKRYLVNNAPAVAQKLNNLLNWGRSEAEAKILP